MNAAVMRGFDVVLHVADEQRLVRAQMIFGEDVMDFFSLVPDVRVGLVEVGVEAGDAALHLEMIAMHRAQKKSAEFLRAAKFEKVTRVRQRAHGVLCLPETVVKPAFQLQQRHVRRVAVVKILERQGKLRAELIQRHLRTPRPGQDEIRCLQNGGQIVHQRPGPVENDVANHAGNLTAKHTKHTKLFPIVLVLVARPRLGRIFDYADEHEHGENFECLKLET